MLVECFECRVILLVFMFFSIKLSILCLCWFSGVSIGVDIWCVCGSFSFLCSFGGMKWLLWVIMLMVCSNVFGGIDLDRKLCVLVCIVVVIVLVL